MPSLLDKPLDRIKGFFTRTFGLSSPRFDHMAKFDEIVATLKKLESS